MSEHSAAGTALTEEAIGDYLLAHPDFFGRHPDVLGALTLPHPHGGRAISLQERQLEVMRERHRTLERRLADVIRLGQENDAIVARIQEWTRGLLLSREPARLPEFILEGLRSGFAVPEAAMRLWGLQGLPAGLDVATPVPDEIMRQVDAMDGPQCGANVGQGPAEWLPGGGRDARSVARLPLRREPGAPAFGLIVLGSPDPDRFHAAMGTDFLARIAAMAGAALSGLLG